MAYQHLFTFVDGFIDGFYISCVMLLICNITQKETWEPASIKNYKLVMAPVNREREQEI